MYFDSIPHETPNAPFFISNQLKNNNNPFNFNFNFNFKTLSPSPEFFLMPMQMAFSRRTAPLNPNANPFHYTTPFHPNPQFVPLFKAFPVAAPSRALLWGPTHGYASYVDHPMLPFYDVVPLPPPWPSSAANSVVGVVGQRNSGRKCKIGNWVPPVVTGDAEILPSETTTIMIKNIPNQLRRHHLLNILDEHCKSKNGASDRGSQTQRSSYDFVYLPMDFRKYWYNGKISNLGYAFVNFTTAAAASEFCKAYHRRHWEVLLNNKVCEIRRAKLQGLKALMEAFRNKIFWCHANNYLPAVLEPPSDGCRSYRATPVGRRISRPPPNRMKKCGQSK